MTRIVRDYPPNIDEIRARFQPGPGTVYAWGDSIYSPDTGELPADLIVHESVHFAQQAAVGGPEAWWRRYIDDAKFRLEQELEAYRAQYASLAGLPRARRRELLAHYSKSLASSIYGGIVTKEQARRLIAA